MNGQKRQEPMQSDAAVQRERRVDLLRQLVGRHAYDVPAEDIAACIIRDAIVIVAPPRATH